MNLDEIKTAVSEVMAIDESGTSGGLPYFKGCLRTTPAEALETLRRDLESQHLIPLLSQDGRRVSVEIRTLKRRGVPRSSRINLVLLLLTVLSTLFAGARYVGGNPIANPLDLAQGVPFSAAILIILGSHELGHFFISRRNGIDASLPFFIPFPWVFGTLGAVIVQRSPMRDKKSLLRIGVAGPLAGLAFAIPISIIGLRLSEVVSLSELQALQNPPEFAAGPSLLFFWMVRVITPLTAGHTVLLHPLAFAGWAGILVTGINLMPIGQLDGGHVAYAVLGRRQKWLARCMFGLLFPLAFLFPGWALWIPLILFLIRIQHPRPLDDITQLSIAERILGWVGLALFLLTFTPIPFLAPWIPSS